MLGNFLESVKELEESLINSAYHNVDIKEKPKTEISYNFKRRKVSSYQNKVFKNMNYIVKNVWNLASLAVIESNRSKIVNMIQMADELSREYDSTNIKEMVIILHQMKETLGKMRIPVEQQSINFNLPALPPDIVDEVAADVREIRKCYDSACFRSVVVLCGRIIETSLHRKYYDVTGQDILEKSPGIGLGKLIARLVEKNIKLDPGLAQQIHLINQVRIFSVHKKQSVFYPSKEQSHAIILYTLDCINKMF